MTSTPPTPTPLQPRRRPLASLRTVAPALAILLTGTVIGATTQHFASASVSSGERTVLIPIEPCRLADTRPAPNTVGPRSVAVGAGDTHAVNAQQSGTPCSGLIPTDASALSLNVTALGATEQSFLTIWAGGDRPLAASLNPSPGEPPVPNAVTTALAADQSFQVYNNAGSVSVIIDVNGYYVDHDHDDRYYTEAESDAMYLTETESDDRYLAPEIEEIQVGAAEFTGHGAGWEHQNLFWYHAPSADLECATAPLDLPVGRSVTSVDLRYSNIVTGVEVGIMIAGLSRSPIVATASEDIMDLYLAHPDFPLSQTTSDEIAVAEIGPGTPPAGLTVKPVADGHDPSLQICSKHDFFLLGANVNLD